MTSRSEPQRPRWPALGDERGSAAAEWVMVSAMLLLVTITVLQIGFALHVRNTALDAAGEGARYAGLFGAGLEAGQARTEHLLEASLSPGYAQHVTAAATDHLGRPAVEVTVLAPLPLLGLLGLPDTMEVKAHAPMEVLTPE